MLFRVSGTRLTRLAEAPIARWSQGAAFSADSRSILVGNMVEKNFHVFRVEGDTLKDTGHRIPVNGGPAAIRIADKPR